MGGIPVVEVTRGGIPVTESDRGVPYEIAANGRGIPVRFVARGGAPFKGVGAAAYASRPAPAGYRWEFVTSQSARVTSWGRPVVALVRIA